MSSSLIQNVLDASLPTIDRGQGVWLWDTSGRRYLDGCSGAVVTAIGHSHPHVLEAMRAQAERVTFTHRGAFTSAALESAAERIARMTGYAGVWFVGSGSEAVEAAMQFALQYFQETGAPERTVFLSAARGYHGNTLGALSASGHARRRTVADIALDIPALPSPFAYREQGDRTEADYTADLLSAARAVMRRHAGRLAAILIEPVGGATLAATTPPRGYLAGLKKLCEEFGALFIADEVMTGMGRAGGALASIDDGITPDLVAMGKGLGAGYTPIAATLVNDRVLRAIATGSGRVLGGHTYAGNPLSAAVVSAVLDVFEREHLIERAAAVGAMLRERLDDLATRHPLIGDVRGRGMLQGLEFVQDRDTREVALAQGEIAARVFAAAMAEGLLVYPTSGGFIDAVQVAPPLTITESEVEELVDRLDRALHAVERRLIDDGALSTTEARR